MGSSLYAQGYRKPVKNLTDGFKPNIKSSQRFDAPELMELPYTALSDTASRLLIEKNIFSIMGKVRKIKKEDDSDIHIEIQLANSDSTIVCESIKPQDSSEYNYLFEGVRRIAQKLKVGSIVIISGLLFQDFFHNPSQYRLRNFLEIHPILGIDVIRNGEKKTKLKNKKIDFLLNLF